MEAWLFRIVLGLHILLAMMWVGGILFIGWGVYASYREFSSQWQARLYSTLMNRTHKYFAGLGTGVILTGVLLGTWLGPLHSWNTVIATRFGHIWLTAFISGTVTLLWGTFVSYPYAQKKFVSLKENGSSGNPAFERNLAYVAVVESVEVLGFLLLIGSMVLLIS